MAHQGKKEIIVHMLTFGALYTLMVWWALNVAITGKINYVIPMGRCKIWTGQLDVSQ